MYLSSITQADFPPKQKRIVRAECLSLKTGDIEGAQPQLRGYQYINKPEFYNRTWDIDRAQPAPQPTSDKTTDFSLTTADIPYAHPMKNEFKTNRLGHNPLEPVYKLPSFEVRPVTPPKFIRDSHTTKDIDGARPEVYFKWKTRNTMTTDDIEGSRPKPEKIYKKPNFMDPRDINKVAEFTSKRSVDPLSPEYVVRDEAGNLSTVGYVDGSKPKILIRTTSAAHNRHITTEDIDGAKAGTKGLGPFALKPREHFRNPVDVSDIDGAQMSSLKKAPTTKRSTNPVWPEYVYPGHSEEPQEPIKTAQTVVIEPPNPLYEKSRSKFYGLTPPTSAPKPVIKPEEKGLDLHLASNQAKFYGDESRLHSPKLKDEQFKRDEIRFYSNTPPAGKAPTFEDTLKTGTIHRRKSQTIANAELGIADGYSSAEYRFYGATPPGSRGVPSSRGSLADSIPAKSPSVLGDPIKSQNTVVDSAKPPVVSRDSRKPSSATGDSGKPPSGVRDPAKPPSIAGDVGLPPKAPETQIRSMSVSNAAGSRPASTGYKFSLSRAEVKPPSATGSRASSLKTSGQQVVDS